MRFALILALALGCAGNRQARRLEGLFDLGDPGGGWERVPAGGADQAWYNAEISGAIYADSNCGQRYDDAPLGRLIDSLGLGIVGAVSREEERSVDGRAALLRVVEGTLDGVPVRVGALVLKKDLCVYDLVYIAPPASFDRGMDGFEAVIGAFHTRGGR